jgi:hypothetical protein
MEGISSNATAGSIKIFNGVSPLEGSDGLYIWTGRYSTTASSVTDEIGGTPIKLAVAKMYLGCNFLCRVAVISLAEEEEWRSKRH